MTNQFTGKREKGRRECGHRKDVRSQNQQSWARPSKKSAIKFDDFTLFEVIKK